MPKFVASRYVEQRFDYVIENAKNAKEAKRIVKELPEKAWGEPETTSGDEVLIFNEDGDEV